ncbi:hypothetical protein WJX75_008352 [Coccomyxa subellipsoidea]|uniref:RNA polymerase sigma-70 region 3 domain-containing protein n=1 Tax=Coccomyxa subellipsoidea TaxID=248742 RepID=A0ABR2YB94_9CHLO
MSQGLSGSKPLRQATPGSLARRRQRQLSGRRAHALRARRTGDSSSAVQEAQHLYRIRHEVAVAEGRHMSDAEWAEAAGMPSIKHLHSVLAAGEAAGLRIIEANRGQLVQLTSKFASQGVSREELMMEAQQELLRVASIFDASKGARLTTYSWYSIMARLTTANIPTPRMKPICTLLLLPLIVRTEGGLLPMSQQAEVLARRMDRMEGLLGQTLGRTPTLSEIAAKIGIPLEKAELLRMRKRKVVPWDLKVNNNADSDTVAGNEWITDGWELDHQREEQERSLQNVIGLALDMLEDERMRQILKWRYGLSDGVPRTLLETAQLLHEYEGLQQMEAFIREHNLLRDLLN